MISEWFQRVGSSVPRGFSRYFILELLKEKSRTGKEIIDYAVEQSIHARKKTRGSRKRHTTLPFGIPYNRSGRKIPGKEPGVHRFPSRSDQGGNLPDGAKTRET